MSLVATPPVLFLDEPTTGLDPRSRVELWDVLRDLVRCGTTLLLTTQYLEEADQLADDIVHRQGHRHRPRHPPPAQGRLGRAALVVTVSRPEDLGRAADRMRSVVAEVHVDETTRTLTAPAEGLSDVTRVATIFDGSEIDLDDLGLQRPSLDEVFLHLTGHRAEDTTTTDEEVPA